MSKRRQRQRLEALLGATIESAPMAIIMADDAGRIVLVNAECEKLFGYPRDRLLGESVDHLVPPRYREQHPGHRQRYLIDPSARRMGEGRDLFALRADGSEFPVEIGLNPVSTDAGRFVLSAVVDITERKRLEAALRAANQELERRVAARTEDLRAVNQQLQVVNEALVQSNLDLQQFAYVASHDLQSPLRSISGFVQLLQAKLQGRVGEEEADWMRRIVEACGRMQELIRDVLAYSRIDSRGRPFELTLLTEVVAAAAASLQGAIADANAQVTWDAELPAVTGDRAQLVQLMENLLDNALKYHGPQRPVVHVSARRDGTAWEIAVADNGIGIDPKQHERIFEVFRRLHDQQEYPGTGIGLSICRRVVQRHGGRIWVDSRAGRGSVFRFTIPEGGRLGRCPI